MDELFQEITEKIDMLDEETSTEAHRIIVDLRWRRQLDREEAYKEFRQQMSKLRDLKNKRKKIITEAFKAYGTRLKRCKWMLESYCSIALGAKFDEIWAICGSKPIWLKND